MAGDVLHHRIGLADAGDDLRRQSLGALLQLSLRERQEHHVLPELLGADLLPVAHHVERAGNDSPLLLGERRRVVRAAAAPAVLLLTAGLALGRPVVLAERLDLDEVDVACRGLRALDRVGVGGAREVRHDVAGLQAQLLEEERVAGRQPFRWRRAARGQRARSSRRRRSPRTRGQAAPRRSRRLPAPRRTPRRCSSRADRGRASRTRRPAPHRRARRWRTAATRSPGFRPGSRDRSGRCRPRAPRSCR